MVNPVVYFYEFYLRFFAGLPDSFRALAALVWGLTLIFGLLNIFVRVIK